MLPLTRLAHLVLQETLRPADWAVDATAGNGHDTAFLGHSVGPSGRVFAFDVQTAAIAATAGRVTDLPHVTLIHAGHEHLATHLPPDAKGRLAAVMFNLGYLPGTDKTIITQPDTTTRALSQALDFLKPGGCLTLMLYEGHVGGKAEADAVRAIARALPSAFAATHHTKLNTGALQPELVVIQRLR
jgi:predicted methyltransferase